MTLGDLDSLRLIRTQNKYHSRTALFVLSLRVSAVTMRLSILLVTFSLMAWLGSCTPINPKRILVNHPTYNTMNDRLRRSLVYSTRPLPEYRGPTKDGQHIPRYDHRQLPKGYDNLSPATPPELNLRKGEYICRDGVCKLQPGVVPNNCNGICQYPIA